MPRGGPVCGRGLSGIVTNLRLAEAVRISARQHAKILHACLDAWLSHRHQLRGHHSKIFRVGWLEPAKERFRPAFTRRLDANCALASLKGAHGFAIPTFALE